jgi:hypothetical protein
MRDEPSDHPRNDDAARGDGASSVAGATHTAAEASRAQRLALVQHVIVTAWQRGRFVLSWEPQHGTKAALQFYAIAKQCCSHVSGPRR